MRTHGSVCLAVCAALALSIFTLNGRARVLGERGMAPELPPDIPGLDRPFPKDNQKIHLRCHRRQNGRRAG